MTHRTRLRVYLAVVLGAGAALCGAVASTGQPVQLRDGDLPAFLIFSGLLVAAEVRPLRWLRARPRVQVTPSWAYSTALAFLLPGYGAALLGGVANLIGGAALRRPPVRVLFNAANQALSLAAGIAVLRLTGMQDVLAGGRIPWSFPLVVVLAGAVVYLINVVLFATVVALSEDLPWRSTVRQLLPVNLTTDGILIALGPVLVVVAERSLWLVPLPLLIAWAVFSSAKLAQVRQHAATHDILTGLANRRLFDQLVGEAIDSATRRDRQVAIALLDLDGFKEVNDRLGHHVGDGALARLGRKLGAAVRAGEVVARVGGDEFAVLLPEVAGADDALRRVGRLHAVVCEPVMVEGFPLTLGGSFGIALFPDHGTAVGPLTDHADVAMYLAKQRGGGVVMYEPDANDRGGRGRLNLLREVGRGLADQDFVVHYQPKVEIATGAVLGCEALVRWQHPRLGLVGPDAFVPLTEQTDLIEPLTLYVLERALTACAEWHAAGHPLSIAVNLSSHNLRDLRLPRTVARLLDEVGIGAQWLELELTETAVAAEPTRARRILDELAGMGVTLSIDDFGTGYSSMSNLRDLPVHCVKIDRSFVAGVLTDAGDAVIVSSIVQLARHLGLRSVAEGVESAEVLSHLSALACHAAQGDHFAAAMPPSELTRWLAARATVPHRPLAAVERAS